MCGRFTLSSTSRVAEAFDPEFLGAASEGERLVLVIDGLEALERADGSNGLDWLPDQFPPNCRIAVSSSSPPIVESLRRRGWPNSECPLTVPERRELIAHFLSACSRRLDADQVTRIASAPQTANPLFLTSHLDELHQVVGSFDRNAKACLRRFSSRLLNRFHRRRRGAEASRSGLHLRLCFRPTWRSRNRARSDRTSAPLPEPGSVGDDARDVRCRQHIGCERSEEELWVRSS